MKLSLFWSLQSLRRMIFEEWCIRHQILRALYTQFCLLNLLRNDFHSCIQESSSTIVFDHGNDENSGLKSFGAILAKMILCGLWLLPVGASTSAPLTCANARSATAAVPWVIHLGHTLGHVLMSIIKAHLFASISNGGDSCEELQVTNEELRFGQRIQMNRLKRCVLSECPIRTCGCFFGCFSIFSTFRLYQV